MAIKRLEAISGCWAKAGDDEPVFVLRSTDALAPEVIRHWADLLEFQDDGSGRSAEKIREARLLASAMEEWQAEHGSKIPD